MQHRANQRFLAAMNGRSPAPALPGVECHRAGSPCLIVGEVLARAATCFSAAHARTHEGPGAASHMQARLKTIRLGKFTLRSTNRSDGLAFSVGNPGPLVLKFR